MTTIIKIQHVKAAGMCSRGARAYADKLGIDWRKLITTGIPADELRSLNDALVDKVIEQAEMTNG